MQSAARLLQMVRIAMLLSVVAYVAITVVLPSHANSDPVIFHAFTVMSITLVAIIFIVRRSFLAPAEAALAVQPDDARALARWRSYNLLQWGLSEAVALYGLVLHFLGFTLVQVAPFFLGSFLLLVFFPPRQPAAQLA